MMAVLNIDPNMFNGIVDMLNVPFGKGTNLTFGIVLVGFAVFIAVYMVLTND